MQYYVPNNGTPTTTQFDPNAYPTSRLKVLAGTIVQGDFHNPNSWSYETWKWRHWIGMRKGVSVFGQGSTTTIVGVLNGDYVGPPAYNQSVVYNQALERLNAKVRGGLDLAVALAEIKSTTRMIAKLKQLNPLMQISREDARRGKHKTRIGSTRDVANGWLEWQYGWKPLMSDIFGIADESIRVVINKVERIKASAKQPLTDSNRRFLGTVQSQVPYVIRDGKGFTACSMKIELDIPAFDLARWTSLNPVSLGWELIPYSFVADWFFDVGSYLRNMETALLYNCRFRSGYVSELVVWDAEHFVDTTFRNVVGDTTYTFGACTQTLRYRKFNRTKLTSYPFPRKPTFNVDLSSARLFSAAALLHQFLKPGFWRK